MRICFWTIVFLAVSCWLVSAQKTAVPAKSQKVCVADVANSSMEPIFTDRVKQALVDALQNQKANAENTYTVTMLANHLALSANNRTVFRREKCDFMLLSEVTKSGGKAPNADHPGPPVSGPLSFDFALFKKGSSTPLRKDSIPIVPGDDATGAALAAGEKIASEAILALKSK